MSTTPLTLEGLAMTKHVQGSLPVGFDPDARPIIARHVFGVEPFPVGQAALEPEALDVTGGDEFWPVPVRKVEP